MTDILQEICARKLEHIDACKARVSETAVISKAGEQAAPRGFERALKAKLAEGAYGFICEIKKASPSKGLIRPDNFHPADLASAYERGGAACLSVLTDIPYFQGHDDYLIAARDAVSIPVLRKDFMLEPYQVHEARALGADCILLIMAALSDEKARDLEAVALSYGMDILIEVHNEQELERALKLKSTLIGINNRNLKTMEVSLQTTLDLAAQMDDSYIIVAESGLKTPADLAACAGVGAQCFLIGETFMRQDDVETAVRNLQKTD